MCIVTVVKLNQIQKKQIAKMGRRMINMMRIQNKTKNHVTYIKRTFGAINKSHELGVLAGSSPFTVYPNEDGSIVQVYCKSGNIKYEMDRISKLLESASDVQIITPTHFEDTIKTNGNGEVFVVYKRKGNPKFAQKNKKQKTSASSDDNPKQKKAKAAPKKPSKKKQKEMEEEQNQEGEEEDMNSELYELEGSDATFESQELIAYDSTTLQLDENQQTGQPETPLAPAPAPAKAKAKAKRGRKPKPKPKSAIKPKPTRRTSKRNKNQMVEEIIDDQIVETPLTGDQPDISFDANGNLINEDGDAPSFTYDPSDYFDANALISTSDITVDLCINPSNSENVTLSEMNENAAHSNEEVLPPLKSMRFPVMNQDTINRFRESTALFANGMANNPFSRMETSTSNIHIPSATTITRTNSGIEISQVDYDIRVNKIRLLFDQLGKNSFTSQQSSANCPTSFTIPSATPPTFVHMSASFDFNNRTQDVGSNTTEQHTYNSKQGYEHNAYDDQTFHHEYIPGIEAMLGIV